MVANGEGHEVVGLTKLVWILHARDCMKQNEIARKRYVARERTRSHGADQTSPDHIQRFPMMWLRHSIRNGNNNSNSKFRFRSLGKVNTT